MLSKNDLKLEFTTKVLGETGAHRLIDRKVTQTIRSRKSAYPFFTKRGSNVEVYLDGTYLYNARITEVKRVHFSELTQWDAELGGLDTLEELQSAAKRAGFRFKNFNSYEGYRIQFVVVR